MKLQSTEKPSVISHHRVNQGLIAILGSLVVMSVFMLVLGATPAQAQTGKDPRCGGFTGQAKGLCTAAVSEGCFDGVQSQACDDLTFNWLNHCSSCAGVTPPWDEVSCPCEGLELFGVVFDDSFTTTSCSISAASIVAFNPQLPALLIVSASGREPIECVLSLGFAGEVIEITDDERDACEALIIQIAANDGVTCQ